MTRRPIVVALLVLLLAGMALQVQARSFRSIQPIATPTAVPEGATRMTLFQPVDRALVEQAVEDVATAWNGGGLSALLADDFASGSRLFDTIAAVVPRDARLTVLAVQAVSTLEQYRLDNVITSTVSAVVRSQIEFNDPVTGFQRLEGTGEWYFAVAEAEERQLARKDRPSDRAQVDTRHTEGALGGEVPGYIDDGRMHSGAELFEGLEPRASSSREASGARPSPVPTAGTIIGTATILDAIPPAVLSAAERPPSDGPRIDAVRPTPVLPEQDLVVSGRRFGSDGQLYLELAGLRLQLAPTRWRTDEVIAPIPAELEPLIDAIPQPGRIWLYSDAGIATSGDVMVGHSAVRIASAPVGIRPAQQIRIVGSHFLADRQGNVSLDCPALGRRFEGNIVSWTDTAIDVIPTGSFSGRVESADCELIVTNHRGQAAARPARLEVRNITLNLYRATEWNFVTDGAVLESDFMLGGRMLRNGWVVVEVRFSVDPDGGHRYEWLRQPSPGSTDTLVRVMGSNARLGSIRDTWDQAREVRFDWTLEGPEGAPLFD